MKKIRLGFETTEIEEVSLEDYQDKWVVIMTNGGNYSGKLNEITKDQIILFPSQQINYPTDMLKYGIDYEKPMPLPRKDFSHYRETTKKEIENFCKVMNRKSKLEYLNEMNQISELEKKLNKNKDQLNLFSE